MVRPEKMKRCLRFAWGNLLAGIVCLIATLGLRDPTNILTAALSGLVFLLFYLVGVLADCLVRDLRDALQPDPSRPARDGEASASARPQLRERSEHRQRRP